MLHSTGHHQVSLTSLCTLTKYTQLETFPRRQEQTILNPNQGNDQLQSPTIASVSNTFAHDNILVVSCLNCHLFIWLYPFPLLLVGTLILGSTPASAFLCTLLKPGGFHVGIRAYPAGASDTFQSCIYPTGGASYSLSCPAGLARINIRCVNSEHD